MRRELLKIKMQDARTYHSTDGSADGVRFELTVESACDLVNLKMYKQNRHSELMVLNIVENELQSV